MVGRGGFLFRGEQWHAVYLRRPITRSKAYGLRTAAIEREGIRFASIQCICSFTEHTGTVAHDLGRTFDP